MPRLDPRELYFFFNRYRRMGYVSAMPGSDPDALEFFQRSPAINPNVNGNNRGIYQNFAAAGARTGQPEEAAARLAEAKLLSPYDTVSGPFFVELIEYFGVIRPHRASQATLPGRGRCGFQCAGVSEHCTPKPGDRFAEVFDYDTRWLRTAARDRAIDPSVITGL